MNIKGPIVVVEDDLDDQFMLSCIFKTLAYDNPVVFFPDGDVALKYLEQEDVFPFIILSDINLPRITGFQLRRNILDSEQLSLKCVPFIFFTTAANKSAITEAFQSLSAQGFFIKPSDYGNLFETIKSIVTYWQRGYVPVSNLERAKL